MRSAFAASSAEARLADQRRLLESLHLPFVETHISYVLFDRGYAYKVKKAVRFPFLDFTTLAAREFFCREELRLNRRLAPAVYVDVVPITGSPEAPVIESADHNGRGPALEYAVKMREFDQDGLLSRVIARDELTSSRVDELASVVAVFHERTPRVHGGAPYGEPRGILEDARENFTAMQAADIDASDRARLVQLADWTEREAARLTPEFLARKADGFIRECHGDLHLGNIALVDGAVTLFDCIEFNPSMRWIDVMSDVAFLVMDLRDRNRPDLAARLLSAYLMQSGDYEGLAVLPFYTVYRALVRAKIACLRLAQTSGGERTSHIAEFRTYVALAQRETTRVTPAVVITHGVSGSGKSTRAQALVDSGAVAIRSDIERKRLHGLHANARTDSPVGGGLYSTDADRRTYQRLSALARIIVRAGYTVVVDAAFLKRWQRDLLKTVAAEEKARFVIAHCSAPQAVLRDRVTQRLQHASDASEATLDVLATQLATEEPLGPDEQGLAT
ncbi:MAG TPA: AAA family ATPase [Vicinamibacterales bacterium]|nr:AAA family ATPase [Vicinamibacterales bacterium]